MSDHAHPGSLFASRGIVLRERGGWYEQQS